MNVPWDSRTAAAAELDWLLEAIAPAGPLGREARTRERPFVPGQEAEAVAAIARIAALAATCPHERVDGLRAALGRIADPRGAVARARAGEALDDLVLFDVARFLEEAAALALAAAEAALPFEAEPALDEVAQRFAPARRGEGFYLDDALDPELAHARAEACGAREELRVLRAAQRAQVARELDYGDLREDRFVLMRDRLRAPLPSAVRVVRDAPGYLLCELRDEPAGDAVRERAEAAEARVATLEARVRRALAERVGAAAAAFERVCARLAALDLLLGRVAFAQRYGAVVPEVVPRAELAFESARLLPLEERLRARGREYTPIAFALERAAVVRGANMGGKSAALRTLAFVAASVALGVPVAAGSVRAGLFERIGFLGAAPDVDCSLLSSFGLEIAALRDELDAPASRRLLLLDEFARTTSPQEGAALLAAVLRTLAARGDAVAAATHLPGVAKLGQASHYMVPGNGDYRPRAAQAGGGTPSDALDVAQQLGLDGAILAQARAFLAEKSPSNANDPHRG